MKQKKGVVVVVERFQGRHLDPGPGLWKYLQDEKNKPLRLSQTKLCATFPLCLCFSSSGLCVLKNSLLLLV